MVKNGGYTELISSGEGIAIDKGKISATGDSGGGGLWYGPYVLSFDIGTFYGNAIWESTLQFDSYKYPDEEIHKVLLVEYIINAVGVVLQRLDIPTSNAALDPDNELSYCTLYNCKDSPIEDASFTVYVYTDCELIPA